MALLLIRRELADFQGARVAIYGLPFAFAFALVVRLAVRPQRIIRPVHREYFRPLLAVHSALFAFSCLGFLGAEVPTRFFEEAFFILAPLVAAGILFCFIPQDAAPSEYDYFVGACLIGLYVVTAAPHLTSLAEVFNWQAFVTSTLATESSLAFPLGLLAVYFVARRNLLIAALAIGCLLLGFKRIAFAATALALLPLLSLPSQITSRRFRRIVAVTAVAVNVAAVLLIVEFAQGRFDRLIRDSVHISAGQLTMGRRHVHNQVLAGLEVDALSPVPRGLGSTSDYMIRSRLERNPMARGGNLHSDLLKALIEFGIVGLMAWVYAFYRLHSFSPIALALALYWNVLWLTDNTVIYFEFTFFLYVLVGLLSIQARSREDPRIRRSNYATPSRRHKRCGGP